MFPSVEVFLDGSLDASAVLALLMSKQLPACTDEWEVADRRKTNTGGQLRSSMSSSTVRGGGGAADGGLSESSGGPGGSSLSSGGLPGLVDLLWRSVGGAHRQQVMVFAGGGALCICLVVSMVCLIGSISRSRRRAKQQRKKLVVLTPDTCEFDTMGESSDSLPMGHIAPPTLTSTLHRASQGSLLGGTLPRHPPPHSNSAALHMGAAGMPGSNPGTIRRIPSDTHPRAPQGSFYYS
ncbi:hypothetical protein BIW11_11090 [Tropilaelaps mercedesae]|uniref:Transmembrane protein n=1 Tax=Tropilaelaps mercedesae TaxID=418985 RepID=A0A1V9XCN6_9ACAR|nr:hypothetical protein BIW11_11090 [Tropilaelaps mercedesae]